MLSVREEIAAVCVGVLIENMATKTVKALAIIAEDDFKIWGYLAHFDIYAKRSTCKEIVNRSGHGKVVSCTITYQTPKRRRKK